MLTSFVAEPLLTGLGAGGYMLVAAPGGADVLLDFFVAAPSEGERAPLVPVDVSFGDAVQVFNVGAASCGVYGSPAGVHAAHARYGTFPLAELAAPAVALARAGVEVNAQQGYLFEILSPITEHTSESRALFMPDGRPRAIGEVHRDPVLADAIEQLAAEGPAPPSSIGWVRAVARSPARTSPPTRRCRASRCASPTAGARSSPTRRRAPAARCWPTRSPCSSASTPLRTRSRSRA